ncbi:MAG: winged helix-turn-helix transcriptional regulator [Verrucomicrobiae bacterium]|nr:winged helix-turn-helix transcriptional regulator [Verrucomicrobiae bacterium]MCP5519004.1 winged helix-turn-helix transcriptional regulator [Verrucomicrobiales bacterium]MCP5525590.1 winged helix-turn-helix transcriptional regulator [Verrucomicrobiales bacterium]
MAKLPCISYLKALADESRWQIVRAVLERPRTVNELAEALGVSQYNISKHLRILRAADIIESERQGKHIVSRINPRLRNDVKEGELAINLGCCRFSFDDSPDFRAFSLPG